MQDVLANVSWVSQGIISLIKLWIFHVLLRNFLNVCVCAPQSFAWPAPIVCETLLTNMTNDVADNDAAYCSISSKEKTRAAKAFLH